MTILFCDVVGSTSLGEATDPETTRRVMSRYAESMSEIVRQHGGTVERFRGDEVMAVFGVPAAHEDDALRAVRTATEMQRTLAELNTELEERWGVALACRIGINTGEVVAGDLGSGEGFVTGGAVNLAKRLEQAAEPGTILIGTATYPLVRDAVKVGPRERFTAKGKLEPAARFRLDEVDAAASGYARRLDAPMVNRTEELEALRTLVREAFAERRCRIVTILGTAGIGKSRLAKELAAELEDVAQVATGRCLPYGSGITFWPLQQLVTDLGGIEAARAIMTGTDDGDVVLERLQAVTGAAGPGAPSTEVFWAVRRLLEQVSERRPLLVAFEDLHWAEPTMLDLVEYIAAFATGPLVLLCIARPELLETRSSLAAAKLELDQLSDVETVELVEALGVEDGDLRRRITSTSEGNPLFAEQLAAMMADGDPTDAIELPASIHALLAARIDSLEPAERRMLERASIVGKEFWPRALAELSSHAEQQFVTGRLMTLVRKGLVKPSRGEVPGEDAYRFRHSLICDETYAGIPKAVRAELHERFARWLQAQAREGRGALGVHDEILGYHLEQAYRYRTELVPADEPARELAAEAGALLASAGRRALGREDLPAAVVMFERSLALLADDDPHRSSLLTELGSAAIRAGEWERAHTLLEDAIASARRNGDRRSELRATIELQWRRSYVEPESAAEDDRQVAESVIPQLEEIDDHHGLAKAWWLLSESHAIASRWGARTAALERAILHARQLPDEGLLHVLVVQYAQALYYGPTPVAEGVRRCTELLAEAPGTPTFEAGLATTLAGLQAMEGRFAEARALYADSVAVYQEFGLHFRRAVRTIIGAQIESVAGDLAAAERELRTGYSMLEQMGERAARSTVAAVLADVLSMQGDDVEAEHFAEIARETAAESDIWPQVLWRRALARTTARRGDGTTAEELARSSAELADTTDCLDLRAASQLALAELLGEAGKTADASARLEEARTLHERKGNTAAMQALAARESAS